jgi:hypothetical protein
MNKIVSFEYARANQGIYKRIEKKVNLYYTYLITDRYGANFIVYDDNNSKYSIGDRFDSLPKHDTSGKGERFEQIA